MGEEDNFIPKPSEENPKGFFENFLFRSINDSIIEKNGYTVKSWNTKIPHMRSDFINRRRMRNLLKRYNKKYENWGWKDPRTCLTLGLWLGELNELGLIDSCRVLYITRDPGAVAQSMVKRGNTDYRTAQALQEIYNQRTLEAADSYGVKPFKISYEELVTNTAQVATAIFDFLGLPFNREKSEAFIDKDMNRCRRTQTI
jgi:hypothetical protein